MFEQQKGKHRGVGIDVVVGGGWVSKCACGWKSKEYDFFKLAKEAIGDHWDLSRWTRSMPGEEERTTKYYSEYKWSGSDGKVGKGPGL